MSQIFQVNKRYQNLYNRDVECCLISHDGLLLFFKNKLILDSLLKGEVERDKQANALRMLLNYLAFEYANCPLSLNNAYYYRYERIANIKKLADILSCRYTAWSCKLREMLDSILTLQECDDNPLLENIEKFIGFDNATLVLVNSDYVHAVLDMCESYGVKVHISTPGAPLTANSTKGVFCGCAKFFSGDSFWAPKYLQLYVIRFAWFWDDIAPFPEPYGQIFPLKKPELQTKHEQFYQLTEVKINSNNPLESLDLTLFERYKRRECELNDFDSIEAKIVILKGGKFVFLPVNGKQHCIVNLDKVPILRKLPISELDENTALLLRERGVGNHVKEMADRILGSKAKLLRNCQRRWKEILRAKIDTLGIFKVSNLLQTHGCKTATYQNIRNWLLPNTICPKKNDYFISLLSFLGVGSENEYFLKNMAVLRGVHISAGRRISDELCDLIKKDKNLKTVLIDGYRIYRTEETSGGKLGVYVFDKILDNTFIVPYTEIDKPKSIETLHG